MKEESLTKDGLIQLLEKEGYYDIRHIDGVGFCGLKQFAFTIGLCYGLERYSYMGRYCYPRVNGSDASIGLMAWNGKGDPVGNWIKHKGFSGEWTNPNFK